MATLGFIGLGNMGAPMAANLLAAGHAVRGYDLSPVACATATNLGVDLAGSAREAVTGADTVITMLPAGKHVVACYADILPAATAGTLFIDCSTIDVAAAQAAQAAAVAAGMVSVDAPVSGGVAGAKAATLTFMVGGTEAAFARAEPILQAMGKRIVLCGDAGAGQAAKVCNNMILGISMIAVSEAFVLAEKLGLSHQALFDVASNASGQCWSLTNNCPVPGPVPGSAANRDFAPGFATALMLKDLNLAQDAAKAMGAHTPLGAHAAAIYARFAQHSAGLDFSAVIGAVRDGQAE
jgi:3-hydroxyisobutyrate dehydrogenase